MEDMDEILKNPFSIMAEAEITNKLL